jgi:hypothetical protein
MSRSQSDRLNSTNFPETSTKEIKISPTFTEVKATATIKPTNTQQLPTPTPEWLHLLGNVYSGVKVYMGNDEEKSLTFTILGGNDNCPFGRGLLVQYPDGSIEWKDRLAMVSNQYLFVRYDDPSINQMLWVTYPCP